MSDRRLKAKQILLNCDLGENTGETNQSTDATVMPHIDMANIACGFHAGDPITIAQTLQLAAANNVRAGAHPAYPDRAGFGRRSIKMDSAALIANVLYQIAALDGMAASYGIELSHVKPHGALYNDMLSQKPVRSAVFAALAQYRRPLLLVIQATPQFQLHRAEAEAAGLNILFEAFADRRYTDSGALLARHETSAVLAQQAILQQVKQLLERGCVTTAEGGSLPLHFDTLCVHGDNTEAVAAITAIRELLDGS